MRKISPEFLKLDGLIAKEAAQLEKKFVFWNANPVIDVNWPGDTSPASPHDYQDLVGTLQSLKNIGDLPTEQQLLVGIGWEFVWGVRPPKEIAQLREEVRNKTRCGGPLSKLEYLWLQLMGIDTDSF